jgi:hypothetical protein
LSDILVPSTRLAAFANIPVVLKLGLSLSGGAPPYFEGGCAESSRPRNEISCEGSDFFARWCGDAERDGDRVRLRRFGGGDVDAELERARCLRERMAMGERDLRASFGLSLRFLSLDWERSRRLCLSLERSRLAPLAESLSFERSRRLSLERSRLRSLERLLLRSVDLSRFPSFSRRLSREPSLLRSRDPSRFLSLDNSRRFRYGSGDGSRTRPLALVAADTAGGMRPLDGSFGRLSTELSVRWG